MLFTLCNCSYEYMLTLFEVLLLSECMFVWRLINLVMELVWHTISKKKSQKSPNKKRGSPWRTSSYHFFIEIRMVLSETFIRHKVCLSCSPWWCGVVIWYWWRWLFICTKCCLMNYMVWYEWLLYINKCVSCAKCVLCLDM